MPRIGSIAFQLLGPPGKLILSQSVIERFLRNRQKGRFSREAGGQLFAAFESDMIYVQVATGPYGSDRRSRFLFDPDRKKEQKDIDYYWRKKLHFVGNWHTHPESCPVPSSTDIWNTQQRFRKSDHDLEAFVMIIVGTDVNPEAGLYVGLVDAARMRKLSIITH